jgi:O-antigen/teichoic acid export membrane protein
MENAFPLSTQETLRGTPPTPKGVSRANGWLASALAAIPTASRLKPVAYSFADQALAVGGGFLVNVALARTQTKQEYGMFALSYSFYVFLTSIHNSTILEPYTVYGSGRYRERFTEYLRLMVRCNAVLGLALSGLLFLVYVLLWWLAPQWTSRALLGLALTVGVLLSGLFLRRVFYIQRQAALAAKTSLVFFLTVACGLWLATKAHVLDSFSAFLVLALGWIVAGAAFGKKLAFGNPKQHFHELEPNYWREHWKYTRWVLATAFVYQFATQAYYWLLAGFLSVTEVGELRAMYMLVAPVEQVLVAISFIVLPALAAHYAAKRMGNFLSLWKRNVLAVAGVTGLFALGVRIFGKPALHILYAGKFDGLAPLLYVLALSPLFMGVGVTMINGLNASEKPKLVFYGSLCGAIATFLFGIPLVSHWGLRGATYGMLLSGATYAAAMTIGFFLNVYNNARKEGDSIPVNGSSWLFAEVTARLLSTDERDEELSPPPAGTTR